MHRNQRGRFAAMESCRTADKSNGGNGVILGVPVTTDEASEGQVNGGQILESQVEAATSASARPARCCAPAAASPPASATAAGVRWQPPACRSTG
jgi:hypothetical protein